ncbi:hypothetical protein [Paenibacillus aquistagni]|uniref:Uncharacterized protein n=1 Tax=Paenibacillus aquistagni TaxID=1852522 RepID=A0A1X7LRE2_9BACL|nr:hypothetical protein [Paenibacillus aquistagni]SMG56476.1 hypothetical protein SAMN06295960_4139 [Paenibacillus aquistagni]
MKKFISGFIVGVLMFAGTVVFADSVGLIGKKVTGIFIIEQNGEKVADAVIIDGSAYAPVRAVAKASGTPLTVEGKRIVMGNYASTNASNDGIPKEVAISRTKLEIESVKKKIMNVQGGIRLYETDVLPRSEEAYKNSIGTREEAGRKQWLDDRKGEYEQYKKDLVDQEAQLKELEAQLSELEK